ncbi:bifunctional adenosylcobinamide kinase/adenosylcobinamide-phosphate guanylyltransferase [Corynebacterium diphtheriae]|uniref:bifunctional adenosylcobinamide kinase/adenosylcobinamide-phosphate guanylyltransferase n=1 Tax=Corynebacterium diphtheriae TaxID=1717 RepID=UPI000B4BF1B4|nr:bifunctional adenosylcobinamide kinase/adenosylcobinamide-phosphate guanylyltransferase [Corynebacterium diphtheriae]OWM62426.1 bifunctional adenosylcobinamide kinase/adenosylcobinamide-phosphate guanylyltransferase [Corynebacterium diphtheriae]
MLTLVLGGARSGKSVFAEQLVGAQSCLYVATARPFEGEFDADFHSRIATHIERRPKYWNTNDQHDLIEILKNEQLDHDTLLVDDLGTWLTHILDTQKAWDDPTQLVSTVCDDLVAALSAAGKNRNIIVVSPEVGMGIIPSHPAGRRFRDSIGKVNAAVAACCDRVVLVVAGLALELKPVSGD